MMVYMCDRSGCYPGANIMKMVFALILRSEEHTSELQSPCNLVCRLLLEKKKRTRTLRSIAGTAGTGSTSRVLGAIPGHCSSPFQPPTTFGPLPPHCRLQTVASHHWSLSS